MRWISAISLIIQVRGFPAILIMAHKSGSVSGSIKKTEFIAKIGAFDTDPDSDSKKMRIAAEISLHFFWI